MIKLNQFVQGEMYVSSEKRKHTFKEKKQEIYLLWPCGTIPKRKGNGFYSHPKSIFQLIS